MDDEPARKRRRTASPDGKEQPSSPLKQPPRKPSFSSRSYITAEDRQSSPLKEPPRRFASPTKRAPDRSSSPLKEPPRKPLRRPSFASPTKASLARGYPDLLVRPGSSGLSVPNGRAEQLARGKEARAYILREKNGASQIADGDETTAGAQYTRPSKPQENTAPRAQRTRPVSKQLQARNGLEEEPDLPATPSQEASEVHYTPRPGLFSSPAKRPPRRKQPAKQSPLLKRTQDVQQDGTGVLLDKSIQETTNGVQQPQQEKEQPPDPVVEEKKREKARLTKELEALEKQVSRCTDQITKIQAQPATYRATPEEREGLISLVNGLCKSENEAEQGRPQLISALLCSFLPFSTQRLAPPKPQTEKPIASHRPLELEDPLPYLQMFTSLEFNTKLSIPRGQKPASSKRVHQRHVVDITGPQSLLIASVSVTIDTLDNSVIALKLLQLSHWADRELGTFFRARAKERDVGNACWAIGSYWDVAEKRAEYWHRCETAFGHLIPGRTSNDTENLDVRSGEKEEGRISRKDLHRHLGRDVLVLEDRHVLLKISWKIGFDWTGEAESEVRVVPAVPRVWQEADTKNSFKKIPETFTSLLHSKGAFAATKTMVALLFSE